MKVFDSAAREQIRNRYLAVDTSNIADVLDTMGYYHQGLSQEFRFFGGTENRLCGWAYTIRGQMTPYPMQGDPEKMRVCNEISAGEVSVWSGDGAGICYFGELIAIGMQQRGSPGALVDGGIRDLQWMAEHKFPVVARYRTPIQSIGRWRVCESQAPVYIRGATTPTLTIRPGDLVVADDDGAIAIPAEIVEEVLTKSENLTRIELEIRAEVKAGLTLVDALKKYGHV
jgi:4-hydroxy-4-methyl-2-oxoglutarate aldolase